MVLPIFSKVYMRGSEGVQVPRYHMTTLHIKNCVIKNTSKRSTYQSFSKERFYTPPLRIFADPYPGMISFVLLNSFSLNDSGTRIYKQSTKGKKQRLNLLLLNCYEYDCINCIIAIQFMRESKARNLIRLEASLFCCLGLLKSD